LEKVSLEPLQQSLPKVSNQALKLRIEKALRRLSRDLEWIEHVHETLVSRKHRKGKSLPGSAIEKLTSWWQIKEEQRTLARFSRVFEERIRGPKVDPD
jgi:hypothetical protein